jgi:predicted small lipoprotein YifL
VRVGRALSSVVLLATLATTVGCGKEEDPELPEACRTQPAQMRKALDAAPGGVTLNGTRLSQCFIRSGNAGDVQQVGGTLLAVAAPLAESAENDPEGEDALRLGYLIGAVRRGAGARQGIYDEIVRRLDQELTNVDRQSTAFRRGERAGSAGG